MSDHANKRRDYDFRPRKTRAQIAKDGFPLFKKLPPEIRSKIWRDVMPPYGIYTVLMLGHEEPMPKQPPAREPMAFRVVYRLEPVPHDQQDDELRARLRTMRAIQGVCSEAAYEVQRAFPTTIDCTGGKLRFNSVHDSLNLSDLQCLLGSSFLNRFARYSRGGVSFKNDWHKIPRTMFFNNRTLWVDFAHTIPGRPPSPPLLRLMHQRMKGFLVFLADCTNLEALGLVYDVHIKAYFWLTDFTSTRRLPFSLLGPAMRDPFYKRSWRAPYSYGCRLGYFMHGAGDMKAVINGLGPAHGNKAYLEPMISHNPRLHNLKVLTVVPVSPTVRNDVLMYEDL